MYSTGQPPSAPPNHYGYPPSGGGGGNPPPSAGYGGGGADIYALLGQKQGGQGGAPPPPVPPDTARYSYNSPPQQGGSGGAGASGSQPHSIQDIMALLVSLQVSLLIHLSHAFTEAVEPILILTHKVSLEVFTFCSVGGMSLVMYAMSKQYMNARVQIVKISRN